MVELIIVAFVAGVLTVLAPCILPLLPLVLGGAALDGGRDWKRSVVIAASLGISVVVFTLLLKASTVFLSVPHSLWQMVSGGLVIFLGLTLLFPKLWEPFGARLNLASGKALGRAGQQQGLGGAVLTGAALGPVFNSCSPTYAFILAAVLPNSLAVGITSILTYAVGLALMILLIALLGQRLVAKLGWAVNPNGWFRRSLGGVFIVVGIFVASGLDRTLQTFLVEKGLYDAISEFERALLQ